MRTDGSSYAVAILGRVDDLRVRLRRRHTGDLISSETRTDGPFAAACGKIFSCNADLFNEAMKRTTALSTSLGRGVAKPRNGVARSPSSVPRERYLVISVAYLPGIAPSKPRQAGFTAECRHNFRVRRSDRNRAESERTAHINRMPSHLTRRLVGSMVRRIPALPLPAG